MATKLLASTQRLLVAPQLREALTAAKDTSHSKRPLSKHFTSKAHHTMKLAQLCFVATTAAAATTGLALETDK